MNEPVPVPHSSLREQALVLLESGQHSGNCLLCALHRMLLNRGPFTLSNDLEVVVSPQAEGSGVEPWLLDYEGTRIHFPDDRDLAPREPFIRWHREQVFRG